MKNIEIFCNCRVVLSGTISCIGPALAIFTVLFLSTDIRADDFLGRIVGISDGDTISVMHDGRAEKVRLDGVDAPEKGQPFGNWAKQFVSDLAFGRVCSNWMEFSGFYVTKTLPSREY